MVSLLPLLHVANTLPIGIKGELWLRSNGVRVDGVRGTFPFLLFFWRKFKEQHD